MKEVTLVDATEIAFGFKVQCFLFKNKTMSDEFEKTLKDHLVTEVVIFERYGIEITKRGDRCYLGYDAGELVVKRVEVEISEEEAKKAQVSENDAYGVVLETQRRKRFKL